jgi:hypothetical protein
MLKRIEDWFLRLLQRRCDHPDSMIAVDILEGDGDGVEVKYCRRCGAFESLCTAGKPYREARWRLPDPDLWRG